MKRRLLFTLLLCCGSALAAGQAQEVPGRKIQHRINPQYPELAQKLRLVGTVNLQLTVSADGTVKECKVLGGHPVLAQAAVDAVRKWRFVAAKEQTVANVNIKFNGFE